MLNFVSPYTNRPSQCTTCALLAALCTVSWALNCGNAAAQINRQTLLKAKPIAEVEVQPLAKPRQDEYAENNGLIMYQAAEEDPLSFYARTQDGEWQIPTSVDADDPWVRLLVLGPVRPTIVDVAIDINQLPYRAAREQWIDKLLSEAKSTSLVRAGEEAAEAASIAEPAELSKAEWSSTEPSDSIPEKTAKESDASTEGEATKSKGDTVAQDTSDVPMVEAKSRQASSLFKRLINYLAADQLNAEREEVRWLLAEWTGGPAQLTLSPAFAWRRADAAPLWQALDADGDKILDAGEINQIASALKQADINRDEIVSIDELQRYGKGRASKQSANGYPLVVVLDSQTDWRSVGQHLRHAYPQQSHTVAHTIANARASLLDRIAGGDQSLDSAELANLLSLPASLVYRVTFAKEDALVRLLGVGSDSSVDTSSMSSRGNWSFHTAKKQTITVEHRIAYFELSAAQGEIDEENASGDMQQTQISIGAVVDGYPLLRLIDRDDNRQLTQREQNGIGDLLSTLDHNGDGQIDESELPTPIRLVVTHGPFAHQQLANPTAAQRDDGRVIESAELPAWFVGMDRNHDGDLSKREFQGSPTQFANFDKDNDGLISAAEIMEAESNK